MKTLVFEGHSDDTFGEYGVIKDDYDNCASGSPIAWRVTAKAGIGDDPGMFVIGRYSEDSPNQDGCWEIGLQQLAEGQVIPNWPMRWLLADSGYSPRLEMDVPDSVTVVSVNHEKNKENGE